MSLELPQTHPGDIPRKDSSTLPPPNFTNFDTNELIPRLPPLSAPTNSALAPPSPPSTPSPDTQDYRFSMETSLTQILNDAHLYDAGPTSSYFSDYSSSSDSDSDEAKETGDMPVGEKAEPQIADSEAQSTSSESRFHSSLLGDEDEVLKAEFAILRDIRHEQLQLLDELGSEFGRGEDGGPGGHSGERGQGANGLAKQVEGSMKRFCRERNVRVDEDEEWDELVIKYLHALRIDDWPRGEEK